MTTVNAIVLAAQDVEVQPFLDILTKAPSRARELAEKRPGIGRSLLGAASRITQIPIPTGQAWYAQTSSGRIVVMRTGVGTVATASALGWILSEYSPRCVVSIGSAGGLATDVNVLDLVVGSTYAYGSADATAFGYKLGQIPGQPDMFAGDEELLFHSGSASRSGQVLTSDSFVTSDKVEAVRAEFPNAISTDMESTAAAQICTTWGIPFVSLRCVSDLCGPAADQDYHVAIEEAAAVSAVATAAMLSGYFNQHTKGRSPLFSKAAIDGALLLILARTLKLEPAEDISNIPDDIATAVRSQLSGNAAAVAEALGHVSAALTAVRTDPSITLTAKKYDAERSNYVTTLGLTSDRGQIAWPPTSQTVSKRSNGYWNDALAGLGIQVKSGRQRGTVKFTEQEYLQALRDFLLWAETNGLSPSVAAYGVWSSDGGKGQVPGRPSSAAIRQRFNTWRAAIMTARE